MKASQGKIKIIHFIYLVNKRHTIRRKKLFFKQKFNYNKNETPYKLLDSMAAFQSVNSTVHQQVLIGIGRLIE